LFDWIVDPPIQTTSNNYWKKTQNMANATKKINNRRTSVINFQRVRNIKVPIATKLILSFLLIIVIISVVFMVLGVRLISDRIVAEAQEKVRNDLNAAREIYLSKLTHIDDVTRFTASRFFLRDAMASGNLETAQDELLRIKEEEELDIFAVTDKYGYVLLRTSNLGQIGDHQGHDELVHAVMVREKSESSTIIVASEDLYIESPLLAEQAFIEFVDTPLAREREETEETAGMMLKAVAPIFDNQGNFLGTIYGGVLINRDFEIIDKVKQTVYEDVIYKGQDIGTATIFQDDLRISTNVRNEDGTRAIGTRVSEEVYNQVIIHGEPWIDRAYVVNNWYITAYEPITDLYNRTIGILYVGVLEQKYQDVQRETVLTFLAITLIGSIGSMAVSYFIAHRILVPINKLVSASQEVAMGNLDAQVEIITNDELDYLADSFNTMAKALKKRDDQLKEFTRQRIMESERLALIGQLSANVAHELNNPLQGIVTFSYLLLEDTECEGPQKSYAEKIVVQANRCRDIIRGLLDFSRQRKPDKTLCDINGVLGNCLSLVENQASFHNIKISKDFQADLPMAIIDPSQIERVFINLIINASEAMADSGHLNLCTRSNANRDFIEIKISDTGDGISKEHINKIFDPFFTTKDVGHGTGLGLAISYGIIKSHKGTISVESVVGEGSAFTVRLPVTTNGSGEG
jgi:two-component system NtrC family sensor kinase